MFTLCFSILIASKASAPSIGSSGLNSPDSSDSINPLVTAFITELYHGLVGDTSG